LVCSFYVSFYVRFFSFCISFHFSVCCFDVRYARYASHIHPSFLSTPELYSELLELYRCPVRPH
jgi:hypothetical protein